MEEAEAILRELWFGWFEGIYNQDVDRIRQVVATNHQFKLATNQFGTMQFERAPEVADLSYSETEVLAADEECTAVWTQTNLSGFQDASTTDVHILRWADGSWRFFSLWAFKEDLWQGDCAAQLNS